MPFSTIPEALEDLKKGKFVIVVDDEDRENEGDLILPAELATEENVAFMVNTCSGVICVGTREERLKELNLPAMLENNEDPKCTAFTVTCDYKIGTTTGISAYDRALTIRKIADPSAKADEFTRPGHVFPLRYAKGGVLSRVGHTEASVDLAELCGLYPAGFLCEIVKKDGTMMRRPDLEKFGKKHGLKLITIADLAEYKKSVMKSSNQRKGRGTGRDSSSLHARL